MFSINTLITLLNLPIFHKMGIYLTQVPTICCGFKRAAMANI